MTPALWVLGTVIGNALDPVLWIGAIAIGCFVRFWFFALTLAVLNGIANDLLVRTISDTYSGQSMGGKILSSIVFTAIIFGVAAWRRKTKQPD